MTVIAGTPTTANIFTSRQTPVVSHLSLPRGIRRHTCPGYYRHQSLCLPRPYLLRGTSRPPWLPQTTVAVSNSSLFSSRHYTCHGCRVCIPSLSSTTHQTPAGHGCQRHGSTSSLSSSRHQTPTVAAADRYRSSAGRRTAPTCLVGRHRETTRCSSPCCRGSDLHFDLHLDLGLDLTYIHRILNSAVTRAAGWRDAAWETADAQQNRST